jgi:GTP cyclohydrolase I
MEKTPERVARMYEFLFNGMNADTASIWGETFDAGSEGIVAVRHIPFYSMCEHHLVPFFGEVSIAYLPATGKVAGFSKFSRLVELLSHRPQLQERLTAQIAAAVQRDLMARGVLVTVEAQQLCMTMRGDLAHGTRTITTECNGVFYSDKQLYQQAWLLLGGEKA